MKTLSRTSKIVILVVIAVVAILSFRAFAQPDPPDPPPSQATFVLRVQNVTPLINQDSKHFEEVLKNLKTQLYDVVLHKVDGTQQHLVPGHSAKLDIKTDKVTISKVVDNGQPGGFTHMLSMSHMVASNNSSDITKVLNELLVSSQ